MPRLVDRRSVSRYSSRLGPSYQGVFAERVDDIVAEARRDRDRHDRGEIRARRRRPGNRATIRSKTSCRKSTRSILLTASTTWRMPSSEQMKRVPPGLQQTRPCAHRSGCTASVGVRGAGRHVAGVLLVARRVGDDERAPRRGEEAVGDVDGDALLALGLEPVEQQREVDVLAGRAVASRIARSAPRAGPRRSAWMSCSSRPIRVDLPSSTEPQVRKRSRSLRCRLRGSRRASMSGHQK